MRCIRRIIAHLTIVLALAFTAFVVLDYFNPLMGFTSNELSTPLLLAWAGCSLITAFGALRVEAARGRRPR